MSNGIEPKHAITPERVVDWIVAQIGTRKLVSGQRLIESAIARDLGIGTVPVREALRTLAGDGVVEITPHRGARIRVMNRKQISDTLKAIMALINVALDELEEQPEKVPAIIPELWAITQGIEAKIKEQDVYAILQASQDYALALMRASENSYIVNSVKKVHLDYYSQEILRYVGLNQLRRIGKNHAKMTRSIAALNFRETRKLFRNNAAFAIQVLRAPDGSLVEEL